jgi:hypothetical protein
LVEQFKVNEDGRSHLGAESPILGRAMASWRWRCLANNSRHEFGTVVPCSAYKRELCRYRETIPGWLPEVIKRA